MATIASFNTPLPPFKRRSGNSSHSYQQQEELLINHPISCTSQVYQTKDAEKSLAFAESGNGCRLISVDDQRVSKELQYPDTEIECVVDSNAEFEDLIPDSEGLSGGKVTRLNSTTTTTTEKVSSDLEFDSKVVNPIPGIELSPQPRLSPVMVAHMKLVLLGSGPPSPPMHPQVPPSPPPEVFAPSLDQLDIALSNQVLIHAAMNSPAQSPPPAPRSELLMDRVQFSPGLLFNHDNTGTGGSALSDLNTPTFLVAQLHGDKPVRCSPVKLQMRHGPFKKRFFLTSIVEGDEPPSKPQFPVIDEKVSIDDESRHKRERTPTKRHQADKSSGSDFERAEEESKYSQNNNSVDSKNNNTHNINNSNNKEDDDDVLFGPTKIDFDLKREDDLQKGLETFTWQLEEPDPVSRISSMSDNNSPVSQHTVSLLEGYDVSPEEVCFSDKESDDSCTEEDYAKFAVAAEGEPLSEVDLHVTPKGRRLPLFSRTPEWTEMLCLDDKLRMDPLDAAALEDNSALPFTLPAEQNSPALSRSSSSASLSLDELGSDDEGDIAEGEELVRSAELESDEATAALSALQAQLLPLAQATSPLLSFMSDVPSPSMTLSSQFEALSLNVKDSNPSQIRNADSGISSSIAFTTNNAVSDASSSSSFATANHPTSSSVAASTTVSPVLSSHQVDASTATIATATTSVTTPPSSPWPSIFLTPPPFTAPLSPSHHAPPDTVTSPLPPPKSKVRWRIATPIVGAPTSSPPRSPSLSSVASPVLSSLSPTKNVLSCFASISSSKPSSFASSSSSSFSSPLAPSSSSSRVFASPLSSPLLSSSASPDIKFDLPFTPAAHPTSFFRSPLTPSTPLSPIEKINMTELLLAAAEEPMEPDENPDEAAEGDEDDTMGFCFPDVSTEIQARSDNILLSINALSQGHFGVGDAGIFDGGEVSLDYMRSQDSLSPDKGEDDDNRHIDNNNNNNNNEDDNDNNSDGNKNGSFQMSLRESFMADPEFKQGTPSTNNVTQHSFFGTMTPLSPLDRPVWNLEAMSSPEITAPSFSDAKRSPDPEKANLARQVAKLEQELMVARSTKEQLAQAFGEAQIQLRASEQARQQEQLFIRKLKSTLESFPPPAGSPPADGRRRLRPRAAPSPVAASSSYAHVSTPVPPRVMASSLCRSAFSTQPAKPR